MFSIPGVWRPPIPVADFFLPFFSEVIFGSNLGDSTHIQLAIYTVFDEESEFQVKNREKLQPEGKNKEKRN